MVTGCSLGRDGRFTSCGGVAGYQSTDLASPRHMVSFEALPSVPGERAADPEGPEGAEEAVLADPPEQLPASFLEAFSAVYTFFFS